MTAPTLAQRRKQGILTGAAGLVMIGILLILVNTLANWLYARFDMTQSRAYSLSAPSKRLVRGLDDLVVVKAYFSPDLPAPFNTYERYARDILTEYRAASHGKLRFDFVPTEPAKDFEQKAMEARLAPLQFEQTGSDQFQIRRGFMGLVLSYGDHTEVVPVIKDIQGLEFEITSRIARMAAKTRKVIAVTSGHGETDLLGGDSKAGKELSQLYDLRPTPLAAGTTAPLQADAILVVGPKQKFDDKSLWAIDQAIMHGTPAAFLLDEKNLLVNQFVIMPVNTGLKDLLKAYGAQLGDQLVYDAQCQTIGITQNIAGLSFTTPVQYPFIPILTHLAKDHPLLQGIDSITVPFPVRVDPVIISGAQAHFTPLLSSSEKSWLAPAKAYSVAPNNIPPPSDPHGPFSIGGVLEGTFTSYFQGKPSPVPGQPFVATSPKNQIFILGSSHILDSALPEFPGESALVGNLLAYITHDDTLLGIRAKGQILRPLRPLSASTRKVFKVIATLVPVVLSVVLGLFRWRKRQDWRSIITAGFAPSATPVAAPPAQA